MHEYFALNMTTDLTSLNERFSQGWVIDRTLEGHGAGMVVIMSRYHPQNRSERDSLPPPTSNGIERAVSRNY